MALKHLIDKFGITLAMPTDAETVAQVYSLVAAAAPALTVGPSAIQAAIYQDDDAHDTCSLTACLNPLHPGPCKGWKHSLFTSAPAAWHALEAARVEKANNTRLKKIEVLKSAGKSIPHKLLQPIVAKPHPHAGKTANEATGEAHQAGKDVSANAGVHVNEPGKVTLGQAVKSMKPVELGPKGKKPTVASKGIAHVIAQEKVTPQYKLDKASAITPEQWAGLSEADQSTIRGELAKVQKDGFGPQQKKATELLAKLPAGAQPNAPTAAAAAWAVQSKPGAPTAAKVAAWEKVSAADFQTLDSSQKSAVLDELNFLAKAGSGTPFGAQAKAVHAKFVAPSSEPTAVEKAVSTSPMNQKVQAVKAEVAKGSTLAEAIKKVNEHQEANAAFHKQQAEAAKTPLKLPEPEAPKPATDKLGAGKAALDKQIARAAEDTIKGRAHLEEAAAKAAEAKPKPLPKHVTDAIEMAKGQAPGASWSKNHLAAYQPLSAEEFKALPPDVQGKIISELGQSHFLDPKKIAAAKALVEKFGHGEAPKAAEPKSAEKAVDFAKDLHSHDVTAAQAKQAVEKTAISGHFQAAKQTAGLTDFENPDAAGLHDAAADATAEALVEQKTKLYDDGTVLNQPEVKAAVEHLAHTAHAQALAQSVQDAKSKAFNKISLKLSKDQGELSPIEKASLLHYQKHLLNHANPPTGTADMDKLKADTKQAETDLTDKLHAAVKQANAPKPEDMSAAQIQDRAEELMGAEALKPKTSLMLSQVIGAEKLGKAQIANDANKYPDAVFSDPNVLAKQADAAKAAGELLKTKAMQQKLAGHLVAHHEFTLGAGHSISGAKLTGADKQVIELHAEQLKDDHDFLNLGEVAQLDKLDATKAAFHEAATKAEANLKPAEPHELSAFDQATIGEAYSGAWGKHATKAVTYGVNSYELTQAMKQHPDYVPLTQDLGNLKVLAGKVALAHAEETTAQLNVPTNPITGGMESGPEHQAWLGKIQQRNELESQFKLLHSSAQQKLDKIRTDVGLKKRALPKLDTTAVKASAAETGYYKSTGYNGPNYGKYSSGKQYMLSKVGLKIGAAHQSAAEKKLGKVGVSAGKAATPSKIENVPSGESVKLGGGTTISHIQESTKKKITSDFKAMPDGKYLTDPTEDIFGNLVNLSAAHGKDVTGGLSVDQVLQTIDETHSKSLGVNNTGMLHKKVTDWLGTSAGKEYAEKHSTPNAKAVKQLTGEVDLPEGVTLAPGEKVQPLAGPGVHDKGLSAKDFHAHTSQQAQAEQDAYKKAQGIKWSAAQKKAMHAYTGNGASAYDGINNYLRGEGGYSPVVKQYALDIQSAMMPLRENTLLKRGTGWPPGIASFQSHPEDLLGKTFDDKGFVSSSVAGSGGHFSGKPLQLVIEAPKGTPAVFVNGISQYEDSENEMLLAAGTKFKVLSVEKTSGGHTLMRVRVVGDK